MECKPDLRQVRRLILLVAQISAIEPPAGLRRQKFTTLLSARIDLLANGNLMLTDPLFCFEQCVAMDVNVRQIVNI